MPIDGLRIGYVPLSADCGAPGDRRRFVSYAQARDLDYEVADAEKHYDVVYLTFNCDNDRWIRYKRRYGARTRLIYELVDAYLFERQRPRSWIRGIGRFATGSASRLHLDFRESIRAICRVADAVVCSTPEQRQALLEYNANVHVSLDVFEHEITETKSSYRVGHRLKLVWEGQPYTLGNVRVIARALSRLGDEVELHLVTDETHYALSRRYLRRRTLDLVRDLECPVVLHPWSRNSFSREVCACDLALIPIDLGDPKAAAKPENKLAFFWLCGVPVLASPTPAYSRAMERAGVDMLCRDPDEWVKGIRAFGKLAPEERAAIAAKAHAFAAREYSSERIYLAWDRLFETVLDHSSRSPCA